MRRALIIGITGQDGSYLAELLLNKGYEVHGLIRRSSSFNTSRIEHLYTDPHAPSARLVCHYGDLADGASVARIIREVAPQEVYNLGAMSHVRLSFDMPEYTCDIVGMGALRVLEALRTLPGVRYYQASSSEIFGNSPPPQSETTPFDARSPYGAAKLFGYAITRNYREAWGLHASNGILFNHESPRRAETFVSRKITKAAARIRLGRQDKLYLGNLDAKRDWGFAGDYVEAMYLMLQQEVPDDYVIATGEAHTVREFLDAVFGWHNIDWNKCVEFDSRYVRPTEVDALCGDASKARRMLAWQPRVRFGELTETMARADYEAEVLRRA